MADSLVTPVAVRYSLPIHATILALQNENGLRHRDHRRYRHYLTRRLRNVRRSLGLMYGKRVYVKKEITTENVKSSEYLLVLLLLAERAWSYYVEFKDESTSEGKHKLIHSAVSRLVKAVKWSVKLRDICLGTGDSRTVLEASAYSDWLTGLLHLELENWSESLSRLMSAKGIYIEMGKGSSLHDQDVFLTRLQDLEPPIRFCRFNSKTDADPIDVDVFSASPDLRAKFEEMRLKQVTESKTNDDESGSAYEIKFAGKSIPVFDEDVKVLCMSVVESEKHLYVTNASAKGTDEAILGLSKERDNEFSAILTTIDNALSAVSKRTAALASASAQAAAKGLAVSAASRVNEAKGALTLLKYYLQYQRLRVLYLRNNETIKVLTSGSTKVIGSHLHSKVANATKDAATTAQRVQEIAHLYDQQLVLVRDMQNVPGVDSYDFLKLQLGTEEAICRTCRSCYIAECYAADNNWAEAVALADLAETLAAGAQEKFENFELAISSSGFGEDVEDFRAFLSPIQGQVRALDHLVMSARCRHIASYTLSSAALVGEQASLSAADYSQQESNIRSLLLRPIQWVEPIEVVTKKQSKQNSSNSAQNKLTLVVDDIPPAFVPIPCKPLFFDIAGNFLEYPDIDERAGIEKKVRKGPVGGSAADAAANSSGIVGVAQNIFGWFSR